MKWFKLFNLLFLFFSLTAFPKTKIDSLLITLNREIANEGIYLNAKFQRIDLLMKAVQESINRKDLNAQFENYLNLYNEYKSFIYDSAFTYAVNLQQIAYQLNNDKDIAISKLKIGFILVSSGLFKEAFDTLKMINIYGMPDSVKFEYYALMTRAYFDLLGYDANDFFYSKYSDILNRYLDSTLNLCAKNSGDYGYYLGLKNIENGNIERARLIYEDLITNFKLDAHRYAMTSSGLAYVYLNKGMIEQTVLALTEAIKADIRSCTKETVAANKLAEILYSEGYVKEAYYYIKLAMRDASFYKANLRKTQISSILPMIEEQAMRNTESQKKLLFHYSIATTLLSVLVAIFLLIIYIHMRKIKLAKQIITDSNNKLLESNKIKDEYIGYYFSNNAEYIDKIEKFKKAVKRKLVTKRIEDIDIIMNNVDLVEEREALFIGFDKVFLKLFPDFVLHFNNLLKENERILLKKNQLLNTDLRIFALIRIGINDHEKIAKILGYSINTIYNYKTKIRNKSLVPHDRFEEEVMKIKAI